MLNLNNLNQLVDGFTVILIDSIDTCANCYALKHELKPICDDMKINFHIVYDTDIDSDLIKKYDILSSPVALLFDNEEMIGKIKGFQPKEILEIWLETKINERGKNK